MMKIIGIILGVFITTSLLAQVAGFGLFYAVDETEYVVITQFGEVKRSVVTPGLKFKSPVETVVRFDRRLLRIDVPTDSMPDRDSQFLDIDAYVRYRINNPRVFLENLRDEITAADRIGKIAVGAIREEVGLREQKDIIGGDPITMDDGTITVMPRVTDAGVPTRDAMMLLVLDRIKSDAEAQFGIEVRDVRIKRADFPASIEPSVLERMRTERDVQAQKLRAEGEEEYLTITADVDRVVRVIRVEAEREANVLSGQGEAQAVQVFARVLSSEALLPTALDVLEGLEALGDEALDALEALSALDSRTLLALRNGNILSVDALAGILQALTTVDNQALENAMGPITFDSLMALDALGPRGLDTITEEALAEDLEFFVFRRSLEAYGNGLKSDTTVVLSADSDIFKYLESASP
jgi:membrane protease subunit HflC